MSLEAVDHLADDVDSIGHGSDEILKTIAEAIHISDDED